MSTKWEEMVKKWRALANRYKEMDSDLTELSNELMRPISDVLVIMCTIFSALPKNTPSMKWIEIAKDSTSTIVDDIVLRLSHEHRITVPVESVKKVILAMFTEDTE